MTYTQAREEALFLTDKMAYELGLYESQYDAVYEINLDYLMALNYQDDLYSTCWTRRNLDLSYVLTAAQYNLYMSRTYFYRPVYWSSGFRYSIYTRYTDRSYYYYSRPSVYTTYRGGHSWRSNGGKSWYKGRTYSSAHKLTPVRTGTTNHSDHSVTTTPKPSKPTNQGHTVTAPKPSTGTASHGRPTTNKKPTTSAGKPATSRPSRGTGTSGSTTVKPSARSAVRAPLAPRRLSHRQRRRKPLRQRASAEKDDNKLIRNRKLGFENWELEEIKNSRLIVFQFSVFSCFSFSVSQKLEKISKFAA